MKIGLINLSILAKESFILGVTFIVVLSFATAYYTSVFTGCALLVSFLGGIAALVFSLELSPSGEYELPNYLSKWSILSLHPGFKCFKCGAFKCAEHNNVSEPWTHVVLNKELDEALETFYNFLLHKYIFEWYHLISKNEEFVQEIRETMRYVTANLARRLTCINVTKGLTNKIIPTVLSHVLHFVKAKEEGKDSLSGRRSSFFRHLGSHLHPALKSRESEVLYLYELSASILPFLFPSSLLSCKSLRALVIDIVSSGVLQSLSDILPNPDVINTLLLLLFRNDSLTSFSDSDSSVTTVELLHHFVTDRRSPSSSLLKMDLSSILKDHGALFAFVQFLKGKASVHKLQFCLSVEDFNKRIRESDINDYDTLHSEAVNIYDRYLRHNATDNVGLSLRLTTEIYSVLQGPVSDVLRLKTHSSLFKAYEETFNYLESIMCPSFYKSEEYLTYLLTKQNDLKSEESSFIRSPKFLSSNYVNRNTNSSNDNITQHQYSCFFVRRNSGSETSSLDDLSIIPRTKTLSSIPKSNSLPSKKIQFSSLISSGNFLDGLSNPFLLPYYLSENFRSKSKDVSQDCKEKVNGDESFESKVSHKEGFSSKEVKSSNGRHSLSEYRDLSAWRVSIPHVKTIGNDKPYFVFVVDVQRIDRASQQENGEDLHWTVLRRHSEFYALESKLTEFHGEFKDFIKLPFKVNLFSGRGLDAMVAKQQPFEDYLIRLLQKPSLRESDILFTFLTSSQEFTVAASQLGLGKMIKNVKLTKEKGQCLQVFIESFIQSTKSPSPQPKQNWIESNNSRKISPHPLFQNNAEPFTRDGVFRESNDTKIVEPLCLTDSIIYLVDKCFKVEQWKLNIFWTFRLLFRRSLNHYLDYQISLKLKNVLNCGRICHWFQLLEESICEKNAPRTDAEKYQRKKLAKKHFTDFFKFLTILLGKKSFNEGMDSIFEALQDPILNKQLIYGLLDIVIIELFPELSY